MKSRWLLVPAVLILTFSATTYSLPVWPGDIEPISSAEVCGSCHRAIHDAWKMSAHSKAMESRLFQDALVMAETEFGAGARKTCLGCHAPLAVQTGDLALQRKVSWEGVTCDYCHSLRDVNISDTANPHAVLQFSKVKSGPLKDVSSSAHGTAFSAVHSSSNACAPCHEYKNAQGLQVLTTYSEWKQTKFAKEGKQCQSCHMERVAGKVVDPRVKATSMAKINLHEMPGSRSITQLNKTMRMNLNAVRNGSRLEISVDVANTAAGHYVPTGSPMRQIILNVRAEPYAGKPFSEERRYQRVIAGPDGKAVDHEHFAFVKGTKVLSDSRLAPGEKRTEKFSFVVPEGKPTLIKATLSYYYSPMARTESQQQINFQTITRFVN